MTFIERIRQTNSQGGQTLVETMVGIFVLTIGISTALGLAISLYSSSSGSVKQVIGTGIAREGVEAVFNMRATNWLKGDLDTGCFNYATGNKDANCHSDWLNPRTPSTGTYDISSAGTGKCYTLDFNRSTPGVFWQFTKQASCSSNSYRLNYDPAATNGFYTTSSVGVPSDYYRQIVLVEQTDKPFTDVTGASSSAVSYYEDSIGPRLKVVSRVWWNEKGCPTTTTWSGTVAKCRVELITYMTNWRNY